MNRKALHLCPTRYCRRPKAKKKNLCSRCGMREWRKANPVPTLLAQIRWRAKRDHREFDLDLTWFTAFLSDRGYDKSLHCIDRISVAKGYVKGNLQVLPISENIAKGNRERGAQLQIL